MSSALRGTGVVEGSQQHLSCGIDYSDLSSRPTDRIKKLPITSPPFKMTEYLYMNVQPLCQWKLINVSNQHLIIRVAITAVKW